MRWHYRDSLLVWAFVAAFGAHILEEWWGGFPEWLALVAGNPLPRPAFVLFNTGGMLIAATAAHAATRSEARGWAAVALATALMSNGILHALGSVATGTYSPGLLTAMILYVPLSLLFFMRATVQASSGMMTRGVLVGLAFHALVIMAAFSVTRMAR